MFFIWKLFLSYSVWSYLNVFGSSRVINQILSRHTSGYTTCEHSAASLYKKDAPSAGMRKNMTSRPWERIDGWGLNPILVPNLQTITRKNIKKVEDITRNDSFVLAVRITYNIPYFGTKTGWISKLSDLAPVWFRSSKSQYCFVAVQLLFQRFVANLPPPIDVLKNLYICIVLKLSSCLVPNFKIAIMSHYCTTIISTFGAILLRPVIPACSKTYTYFCISLENASFGFNYLLVLRGSIMNMSASINFNKGPSMIRYMNFSVCMNLLMSPSGS